MNDETFIKKYEELLDKGYCNCNEMNCLDNDTPRKILSIVKGTKLEAKQLLIENQELQSQLKYLRSGEYFNQLRFERDMLQHIVDNNEVSKEDKEFIDMTHRNTELLEENEQLKKELKILSDNYKEMDKFHKSSFLNRSNYIKELEKENQQLKEQQKEFIDYLEKEIVDSRAGSSQYYSAIQHLKLFKEIIGSDKQ